MVIHPLDFGTTKLGFWSLGGSQMVVATSAGSIDQILIVPFSTPEIYQFCGWTLIPAIFLGGSHGFDDLGVRIIFLFFFQFMNVFRIQSCRYIWRFGEMKGEIWDWHCESIWRFPKPWGYPNSSLDGWWIMENPTQFHENWGVPPWETTTISFLSDFRQLGNPRRLEVGDMKKTHEHQVTDIAARNVFAELRSGRFP